MEKTSQIALIIVNFSVNNDACNDVLNAIIWLQNKERAFSTLKTIPVRETDKSIKFLKFSLARRAKR